VVQSGDGSRLLAFSNNHNFLDTVTIVSPFKHRPRDSRTHLPEQFMHDREWL